MSAFDLVHAWKVEVTEAERKVFGRKVTIILIGTNAYSDPVPLVTYQTDEWLELIVLKVDR